MKRKIVLGACLALSLSVGQQAPEALKGVWLNDNPSTGGITKVEIRSEGQRLLIHVWGKCHPQDCDWGEIPTTGDNAVRRVHWNQGFADADQDLTVGPDGRLTIITRRHFKDASGRPDFTVTERMVKTVELESQPTSPATQSSQILQSSLQHGALTVWVPDHHMMGLMGDPTARVRRDYRWETLLDEFKRDFPTVDLRFKILERDEFLRTIHAPEPNQSLPDVMFVDNAQELQPLLNGVAVPGASRESRFASLYGGWWVRFVKAQNTAAAEAFMLWLSQSPNWRPWPIRTTTISATDAAAVETVSKQAVQAFLQRDPQSLSLVMDREATHFDFDYRPTSVERVETLLSFGNSRLGFALISSTGVASGTRIVDHWATVVRKSDGGWKVLLFLEGHLPALEEVLKSFDGLALADATAAAPPGLTLLGPADHAPVSRYPRSTLEWAASVDEPPAAYLIEWQMGQPGMDFWPPSRVVFVPPLRGATLRTTVPFGVGRQPHRWRVWYLGGTSVISTSEWRTIDFTN